MAYDQDVLNNKIELFCQKYITPKTAQCFTLAHDESRKRKELYFPVMNLPEKENWERFLIHARYESMSAVYLSVWNN